jgi:hypothetical protein
VQQHIATASGWTPGSSPSTLTGQPHPRCLAIGLERGCAAVLNSLALPYSMAAPGREAVVSLRNPL